MEDSLGQARRQGLSRLGPEMALLLAVLLSGAAGLVYQVAWTRRLASVTSVTFTAQAVVLAVFMGGLGMGALLAGRRARRARAPLLGYIGVECGAAVLALASMPIITRSDALRMLFTELGGSPAYAVWVQLLVVACYLLLPATLLGASLPFVIEWSDRRGAGPERSARWISLLYALNTLGAATGCWLAGFVTIEQLGLARSTWVGAGVAVTAALLAAAVHGGTSTRALTRAVETTGSTRMPWPAWRWWWMAGVAGFVGLAAEVVWTRLISLVVLNTVYAFTQVLAWVLIGIALGAALASVWIRASHREPAPGQSLERGAGLVLCLAAVSLALMPLALVRIVDEPWLEVALSSGFSPAGNLLLAALLVPPSALVASLLPLLVARVRLDCGGADGFAALYAANTAGSVVGSLGAGFVLIPLLGSAGALGVLVLTCLLLSAQLLGGASAARRLALPWAFAALASALLLASVDVPRDVYLARVPEGTTVLEFREGRHSDVMVTQSERGVRRIWINSSWVAGTGGGHRSLGHLPALLVEEPRALLGIALGTGQTFASVFAHGAETLDCVELDAGVIELSTRWFAEANGRLFERPGVRLHNDDGRAFLRATEDRFDVIVLEPLQAWSVGTANLYSREFYEEAERVLAPGGVLAQWIPFYGQSVEETRAMVRTARSVFPEASLWLDDNDGILLLQREPFALSPEQLGSRIRDRGLAEDLARNGLDTQPDLLSLFVMGPRGLDAWQAGAEILEDDRPFLEFAAARTLGAPRYDAILASMEHTADLAVDYIENATDAERRDAERSGRIRAAILSERLLAAHDFALRAERLEQGLEEAPNSELLRRRYRDAMLGWAISLETDGRVAQAEQVYQRALDHLPSLGEAAVNLSLLYARTHEIELARSTLDRSWSSEPLRASAQRALALIDDLERRN